MIAELATTAAAVYGIYVAHRGLSIWREQTIGKRNVALCEDVMARLYEAQSRLRSLRSPAVWAGEGSTRPDRNEEGDEKRRRDILFAPIERYDAQLPFWRELLAHRFKMKAFVPDDTSSFFDRIDKLLSGYRAAATTRYDNEFPHAGQLHPDTLKTFDSKLFEWGETDATRQEMDAIVKDMESICLRYVRMRPSPLATAIERLTKLITRQLRP